MWANLLRLSVRSGGVALGTTLVILSIGLYGLVHVQIDAVPDITNNQVQVYAYAPGYSATEVELLVTRPIETALATVPDRIEWRSISRMGLSLVTIVFAEGVDLYRARAQIAERLVTLQGQLPAGVQPEIGPLSTGLSEAYQYVLVPCEPVPLSELRTIQDWLVRRALLEVPGVADVSSFGGYVRRWEIRFRPEALDRYGLTLTEVEQALFTTNQLTGGGFIEKSHATLALRAEGIWRSPDDIRTAVVAIRGGRPIRLIDIATVEEGHLPRYGALLRDTLGEAVGGIVLVRKGENTAEVIRRLKAHLQTLESRLPHGIQVVPFLDREDLIQRLLHTVSQNLLEAALLVIALVTVLLGSWRAGLVVGAVIPLSMFFALGLMSLTGLSANLMSLGAIDFGLIVDGTVILVEAVLVRLATEPDRLAAAEKGAIQIRQASLFGEMVVLSVYLPLLFLSGVEGKMFRPMVLTMMFALAGALVLSLTFVPWVCARFLRPGQSTWAQKLHHTLQIGSIRLLRWTARHPRIALASWTLFLVGGSCVLAFSESIFLPELEEGALALGTRLPLGSSLSQTLTYCQGIHRLLRERFPGVFQEMVAKVGTSEIPMDPMFVESADLILTYNPDTHLSRAALAESVKTAIQAHYPGIFISVQQPIQMRFNELLAGARTDVVIRLLGPDLDTLTKWGEILAGHIQRVPGVTDLARPLFFGAQQVVIRWKPEALAFYGVDLAEAQRWIQAYRIGLALPPALTPEGLRVPVVLCLTNSPETLSELMLPTGRGTWIPLAQVAEIRYVPSFNEIPHAEGERSYTIGVNVRGRGTLSVVKEIQALASRLPLPPGYRLSYGGQWQNYLAARERLFWIIPLTVLLVGGLMYLTLRQPGAIGLILLVSLSAPAGGLLSLALRGLPFSLSAAIGLISVFGLTTLQGTVLLNRYYSLQTVYPASLRALLYALRERTRPILTTTLIAAIGLLPMAFSEQAGAEVQRPFATTVIGGLLTGTFFTLWLLPLFYARPRQKFTPTSTPTSAKSVATGAR